MKSYSNPTRKPMMYGGMTNKKMMAGGMATSTSGMTSPTMVAQKAKKQTQQPPMGMAGNNSPEMPMMYGGMGKKK